MHKIALAFIAAALLTSNAFAGPLTGQVSGTFSNPDYTGNILLPSGGMDFYDNTATGVFVTLGGTDDIAVWGNFPPTEFFGASILSIIPNFALVSTGDDDEVLLGQLRFDNGTSELDKLIFGVDLTLSVARTDGGLEPVVPFTFHIQIVTSANSVFDPVFDADSLVIDGLAIPNTISAFEGGPGVIVNLYGKIVGDPMIELTRIELAPNSPVGGGFIQDAPRTVAAPEPSSLVLGAIGALALTGCGWRKRRKARIAA